jgi:DNA polymerase III subunit epsilon
MNSRPAFSIDIEATGVNPATDRIIQLAIVSETFEYSILVNPGTPIPVGASEIHGITDDDVADKPPFLDHAGAVHKLLQGVDLIGFNLSNFDVPLLWEELYRCGIEWDLSDTKIFDAGTLFKRREERTLAAAVKFYLGIDAVDLHDAVIDAKATLRVLFAQCVRYGLNPMDRDTLAKESAYDEVRVDLAGKIVVGKDGRPTFNFGKAKGVAVEDDTGYAMWMLRSDFTQNTKKHLEAILYPPAPESEAFKEIAVGSGPF